MRRRGTILACLRACLPRGASAAGNLPPDGTLPLAASAAKGTERALVATEPALPGPERAPTAAEPGLPAAERGHRETERGPLSPEPARRAAEPAQRAAEPATLLATRAPHPTDAALPAIFAAPARAERPAAPKDPAHVAVPAAGEPISSPIRNRRSTMPSSPNWKLRRLAPRAIRVLARRGAESPAMAAYDPVLKEHATAFIAAYDATLRHSSTWRRELYEGRGAAAAMLAAVRAWLPLLARDVPGFDAASYAGGSAVPDDLLADAERLAEQIEEARTPVGEPLPYVAAALAALDTATVAARKEWAEAEAADRQYQAQLAATPLGGRGVRGGSGRVPAHAARHRRPRRQGLPAAARRTGGAGRWGGWGRSSGDAAEPTHKRTGKRGVGLSTQRTNVTAHVPPRLPGEQRGEISDGARSARPAHAAAVMLAFALTTLVVLPPGAARAVDAVTLQTPVAAKLLVEGASTAYATQGSELIYHAIGSYGPVVQLTWTESAAADFLAYSLIRADGPGFPVPDSGGFAVVVLLFLAAVALRRRRPSPALVLGLAVLFAAGSSLLLAKAETVEVGRVTDRGTTSFIDRAAASGQTSYYKVVLVTRSGTADSNVATVPVPEVEPAGDTLSWSLPTAPSGAAIDEQGVVRWTPRRGDGASANVVVRLTSVANGTVDHAVAVQVAATTIESEQPIAAAQGGTVEVTSGGAAGVEVTVPAQGMPVDATVAIGTASGLPPLRAGVTTITAAFRFTAENSAFLDGTTAGIPYDEGSLPAGSTEADIFVVAYYHGAWFDGDVASLDSVADVATVALFGAEVVVGLAVETGATRAGTEPLTRAVFAGRPFNIDYEAGGADAPVANCNTQCDPGAGAPDGYVRGYSDRTYAPGVPDYVQDVAFALQDALTAYRNLGYADPTAGGATRIRVKLRRYAFGGLMDRSNQVNPMFPKTINLHSTQSRMCGGGRCYDGGYPTAALVKSVVAHELFHLVQYSYNRLALATWSNDWAYEGTAQWATGMAFPEALDIWGRRIRDYYELGFPRKSWLSSTALDGGNGYDAFPFWLHVQSRFGSAALVDLWEQMADSGWLEQTVAGELAADRMLALPQYGSSLEEEVVGFADRWFYRHDDDEIFEADHWVRLGVLPGPFVVSSLPRTDTFNVQVRTCIPRKILAGLSSGKLVVTFSNPDAPIPFQVAWRSSLLARRSDSGAIVDVGTFTGDTGTPLELRGFGTTYSEAFLDVCAVQSMGEVRKDNIEVSMQVVGAATPTRTPTVPATATGTAT
ncbi:MAG: hypothetical protein HYV63_32540, partial [Candidatus Schekmanbacteria bacterium]|nr:hypothetical protein [Candidatus Schekmanbacteria bacterium]